jgi:2-polyprenyl-3-methyl-5-hydroxy-6-metoxy-1,4-benzoquinol methylase
MTTKYPNEKMVMSPCDTYSFNIFETNPRAYKVFLSYLQSVPMETSELVKDCINKLINRGISKIKWLDVGAGLGDPVFPVLRILEQHGIKIEYHYLDPSISAYNIFLDHTKMYSQENVVSSVNITTWEDYSSTESFDLITFFHSAYYIKNWFSQASNSLEKAIGYLEPDGFIFFSNLDQIADYNKVVTNIENESGHRKPPITSENILECYSYLNLSKATIRRTFRKYLPVQCIKNNNYRDYKDIVEFLSDKPFTDKTSKLICEMPNNMLFPISTITIPA